MARTNIIGIILLAFVCLCLSCGCVEEGKATVSQIEQCALDGCLETIHIQDKLTVGNKQLLLDSNGKTWEISTKLAFKYNSIQIGGDYNIKYSWLSEVTDDPYLITWIEPRGDD